MSFRVFISADYSEECGDRDGVNTLNQWGSDNYQKIDFVDMAKVVSGSGSNDPDCRICDLKEEFNTQIIASSAVIVVIGDKTASRTAGSSCSRNSKQQKECYCTPYKQNTKGLKICKISSIVDVAPDGEVGNINSYSYLRHEFEQAKRRKKKIIVVYNSLYKKPSWIPSYMQEYEESAQPFWIKNTTRSKIGNYDYIKQELGYV